MGPVHLYQDYRAQNVENGWQFSKVYKQHTGAIGRPTEDYWQWATKGWADTYAHRYPMGKGAKPEYSYWDGKMYGYIDARINVYLKLYWGKARKSDAYSRLEREYWNNNKDIILFDYDAYDHQALGMSWDDVLKCESKKMGHGFILSAMLEGILD